MSIFACSKKQWRKHTWHSTLPADLSCQPHLLTMMNHPSTLHPIKGLSEGVKHGHFLLNDFLGSWCDSRQLDWQPLDVAAVQINLPTSHSWICHFMKECGGFNSQPSWNHVVSQRLKRPGRDKFIEPSYELCFLDLTRKILDKIWFCPCGDINKTSITESLNPFFKMFVSPLTFNYF